jgi:serine/threonine protein kinase
MLHEHLYNTRTGSVFRVTDRNSNTFGLKVFSYVPSKPAAEKAQQLVGFGTERAMLLKITKLVCPKLLEDNPAGEPFDISCDNSHLEMLHGMDVEVIDREGKSVKSLLMNITNSQGIVSERRLDFTSNILVPYMSGGRLGDVVDHNPALRSIVNRYLAYTVTAVQLIESVRKLHELGIAHLGIAPSTVYCSNPSCDEVTLGEFSRAYAKKDPILSSSRFTSEMAQDSVRYMSFEAGNSPEQIDSRVIKQLSKYADMPISWESVRKVDWFGLGGTFFYIVGGSRIFIDSIKISRTSSRALADFIVTSMSDKHLISRVTDKESRKAFDKIRDNVAEGLTLIDGLLSSDRSKRISFDTESAETRVSASLRANKAVMSALQTETKVAGRTCASFLAETRRVIPSMSADVGVPSFLQTVC